MEHERDFDWRTTENARQLSEVDGKPYADYLGPRESRS